MELQLLAALLTFYDKLFNLIRPFAVEEYRYCEYGACMHYLTLKMTFRAEDETAFPMNPVNTFRGALGYALKSISCKYRNAFGNKLVCNSCEQSRQCPYALCYETNKSHFGDLPIANLKSFEIPRLMYIDCGFPGNSVFKPGERFSFPIRLLGSAVSVAPYLIIAAKKAGEDGLRGARSLLELIEDEDWNEVWTFGGDRINIPDPKSLYIPEPSLNFKEKTEIKLSLVTPVAFKDGNTHKISREPDFSRIIGSLMRRYTVFEATEGKILNWRFDEISEMAAKVIISGMNIEPIYWERYSTRQLQRMAITGIIGEVRFIGPIAGFMDLLEAGEIIRCGRSISFGQGRISVTQYRHVSNRDEFQGYLPV